MNPADIVTLGAFFAVLIVGLIVNVVRNLARQQPAARIRERLLALQAEGETGVADDHVQYLEQLLASRRYLPDQNAVRAIVARWHDHLRTAGAPAWSIYLVAAAALGAAVLLTAYLPLWPALRVAVCLGAPVFSARAAYGWLIARFRRRFLATFPDTIDLVIRAVRAGIPVVQAICVAGVESEEPVRSTFRSMGDALLVGAELKDVLGQAVRQVRTSDFSFFAVCLLLQRETGGNLGDTLENLSGIVRMRREIRAKARALTAEGRIASKMIATVPFLLMAFLYFFDRPYLERLTLTPVGHKILAVAAVLLVVGLWSINRISNLDTART